MDERDEPTSEEREGLRHSRQADGEGPESAEEITESAKQGENGGLMVVDEEPKS